MSQNLRVATWIPIVDPAAVGSVVRSTAAANVNERIATEFTLPGTSGGGGGDAAATAVSDTPPVSPTDGMLWWESDSGRLYIRYSDPSSSQWVLANPVSSGSGGGAVTAIGDTPPVAPVDGQLWWESDSGKLYIRYSDPSSSQWVLANPTSETSATVIMMHNQENRLRAIEGQSPISLDDFRAENGV